MTADNLVVGLVLFGFGGLGLGLGLVVGVFVARLLRRLVKEEAARNGNGGPH